MRDFQHKKSNVHAVISAVKQLQELTPKNAGYSLHPEVSVYNISGALNGNECEDEESFTYLDEAFSKRYAKRPGETIKTFEEYIIFNDTLKNRSR